MKLATVAMALALGVAAAAAHGEPQRYITRDNGKDDIGFGLGLSWQVGAKAWQRPAISFKAFSKREEDSLVASVGVDYLFEGNSLRPNLGVAYLAERSYLGVDYGYSFGTNSWGIGFGAGFADTAKETTDLRRYD